MKTARPVVSLKIADQAKFAEITQKVSEMGTGNNIMIVWLDYEDGDSYVKEAAVAQAGGEAKYISAAQVKSAISGDCVISGGFTESEAREPGGADQFRQSACQDDRNLLQRRQCRLWHRRV